MRQEVINVANLSTSLVEFTQWATCILYTVKLMPFFRWKLTPLSMYTQRVFLILFSYEDKVDEIEINHNIF